MKLKKIVVLFLLAMQTPLLAMNHGPIPEERMPRLLILGKTGAGKSTMINALYNLAIGTQAGDFPKKFPIRTEFQACNVPQYADRQVENLASTNESTTMDPTEYVAQGNGFVLKMIDSPGAADTRGVDVDSLNSKNIAEFVANSGSFNAICIVLKNTDNRLTAEELYLLEQIKSIIPRSAYNRIFFLISNATIEGTNLESFIRGVGLPTDNMFYFENLAMTQAGHIDFNSPANAAAGANRRNGPNRIASMVRQSWADSQAEFEELKNRVINLGPYSSDEMRRIGQIKGQAIEKISAAHNRMSSLEGQEARLEDARRALQVATTERSHAFTNDARVRAEANVALAEKQAADALDSYEYYSLTEPDHTPHHNTICLNCHQVCHEHCQLDDKGEEYYDHLSGCHCITDGLCTKGSCKCSYTNHRHRHKKFVTVQKQRPNATNIGRKNYNASSNRSQSSHDNLNAKAADENAKAVLVNHCNAALENLQQEIEQLKNDIATLYVELGQVSMGSIDFHIGEYYDVLIRREPDNLKKAKLSRDRQFYLGLVHRMQGQRARS